jgi:hypothetical protein
VCPGCAATAHTFTGFTTTMYASSKMEKKIIQHRETRRRTLAHLCVLIRLLLLTLGKPTTPTVTQASCCGVMDFAADYETIGEVLLWP